MSWSAGAAAFFHFLQQAKNALSTGKTDLQLAGVSNSAKGFLIQQLTEQAKPYIILTNSFSELEEVEKLLTFFQVPWPIFRYPSYDTLPFDGAKVDPNLVALRLRALENFQTGQPSFSLLPINALMDLVLPPEALKKASLVLQAGEEIDRKHLSLQLQSLGYVKVDQVLELGEFSFRGDKLDVFPPLTLKPLRLNWFDNLLETIQTFDVDSQISEKTPLLPSFRLYALTEVFADRASYQRALERLEEKDGKDRKLEQELVENNLQRGFRPYLSLFYPDLVDFFHYLPKDATFIWWEAGKLDAHLQDYRTEIENEFVLSQEQGGHFVLEELFQEPAWVYKNLTRYPSIQFSVSQQEDAPWCFFPHLLLSTQTSAHLTERLEKTGQKDLGLGGVFDTTESLWQQKLPVFFVAQHPSGAERISQHLAGRNLPFQIYSNFSPAWLAEVFAGKRLEHIPIFLGAIDQGFWFSYQGKTLLSFYSEAEIFGHLTPTKAKRRQQKFAGMRSLEQLKVGDYAVHVEYGIGRYLGLSNFSFGDHKVDCLTLEYASGDKVYVPVDKMHLVQKYSNLDKAPPSLHKLGELHWQNAKKKVLESVESIAKDLVALYAKRKIAVGKSFLGNPDLESALKKNFAYVETEDQQQAIEETLEDLAEALPMDRLICGDVGFGKTEVALRAAFRVAISGYQVALIAPTTILAEQHYANFIERLKQFPVKVGHLSRFLSSKDIKATLQSLQDGELDIVIGTHRLLSEDVQFQRLGLLIIDEEHRFGVKQKEKLRMLVSDIDTLAMSATPIPRTLHLSLNGIRDISLITTPPVNRRTIKSRLLYFDSYVIRESIERELRRNGQVYFIHNFLDTIEAMADFIRQLFPKKEVAVAHGQMDKKRLEEVMHRFVQGEIPILLASTIVESGLDISNANTMIINHADQFGLAQLYQLRGRVGRSDKQAYVYYLTPKDKMLSPEAEKRLHALQQFTELASGYKLANLDMEIRGVGDFFGHKQSGNIQAVGLDFYLKIFEEKIEELKHQAAGEPAREQKKNAIEFNSGFDMYLPESYIEAAHLRLELYQELSELTSEEELWQKKADTEDRFGPLPEEANTLFDGILLKIYAQKIQASRLDLYRNRIEIKILSPEHWGLNGATDQRLTQLFELLKRHRGKLTPAHSVVFEGRFAAPKDGLFLLQELERLFSS